MKKITIYTDGACSGNPGNGGWGCVLEYCGKRKEFSGFEELTTNNRMELYAVISALKKLKESCEITIYSDSAYVVNAFLNNWISSWIEKDWKGSDNKTIKNVDLWQELFKLLSQHNYSWIKVKGHSDNVWNNRCDKLATDAIKKYQTTTKKDD